MILHGQENQQQLQRTDSYWEVIYTLFGDEASPGLQAEWKQFPVMALYKGEIHGHSDLDFQMKTDRGQAKILVASAAPGIGVRSCQSQV